MEAIEAVLGMNDIALVPMGEKFLKVVQSSAPDLGGHGLKINIDPEQEYTGSDKLVTQIIQLKNVEIPEVQAAIQHVMHAYGKIQTLERSNSLMITDTESNILRIRELVEFLDQATARIEPRIYQIEYADATEIASKLNEIITMAQADQKTTATTPSGTTAARTPPGVIRARANQARPASPTQATISSTEGTGTVIIQGTVKVMADERTNIILIFSQEDNFDFFDTIIKVLDVEVEPAITFEVVNLEYADAAELSSTLNELVGAAQSSKSTSSGSSSSQSSQQRGRTTSQNKNTASSRQVSPKASPSTSGGTDIENLSRLSENTKILADERSNSILLMGEKSDIAAIKNVIASLDVMLEQVVIEAAIFEIGLDDSLEHGIDWIYRSQDGNQVGAWDGKSILTNSVGNVVSGALSYYLNAPGINTEFLVNLSKTDTDARLIQTPVIMTTDNTEAILNIGEQRPVVTSTDNFASQGGSQRSNYEYKDIGIQLTVTPRINPQRFVVMELTQKADSVGGNVDIDGTLVPIIKNREFTASIAVPDGGTVVLGGLISTEVVDSVNKIPILGDIPLIGRYLFSSISKVENQRELIVLMTPYVMTNQKEMLERTELLYEKSSLEKQDWKNSWSDSKLRQIPDSDDSDTQAELNVTPNREPNAVQDTVSEETKASAHASSIKMEENVAAQDQLDSTGK
jgi:general secretion pathway protein D